jgi:hypothetical protein
MPDAVCAVVRFSRRSDSDLVPVGHRTRASHDQVSRVLDPRRHHPARARAARARDVRPCRPHPRGPQLGRTTKPVPPCGLTIEFTRPSMSRAIPRAPNCSSKTRRRNFNENDRPMCAGSTHARVSNQSARQGSGTSPGGHVGGQECTPSKIVLTAQSEIEASSKPTGAMESACPRRVEKRPNRPTCRHFPCRRRDSNPRHADYDSASLWLYSAV